MSEESTIRRRIEGREHARPGGLDPALNTPWAKPKYSAHPGHRWQLAPERNLWIEGEPRIDGEPRRTALGTALRRLFGRKRDE